MQKVPDCDPIFLRQKCFPTETDVIVPESSDRLAGLPIRLSG